MATVTKQRNDAPPVVGPGTVLDYQREGIVNLARRLGQVLMSATSEAVPEGGLRNEFGLLVAISHASGLEQKSLAAVMALDVTTIGQLVDALEAKGQVRRVSSATDRRVKLVEITEKGRKLVAEYRPRIIKAQAEVLAVLSAEERRILTDLIARVESPSQSSTRPFGSRTATAQKQERVILSKRYCQERLPCKCAKRTRLAV